MWNRILEVSRQDARDALRGLRKSPGFTAATVLTLALGIGATTAIFGLLDAAMLKPLPVRHPDELVLVRAGGQYPVFVALRAHAEIFADLCASSGVTRLEAEIDAGLHEPTDVSFVSGSYFSTFGVAAAAGRVFTDVDDRTPGEHPVAVISDAFWRRRFGSDPRVVGRMIRVSSTPIAIVGITPPAFFGEEVGASPDVWIPLAMWAQVVPGRNLLQSPGTGWLRLVGRVRRGAPVSGAQPALTATFRGVLTEIFGPLAADDIRRDIAAAVVTFEPASHGVSGLRARFGRPLLLLMGAVALLLLIACSNIANLLLARATARRREIDVRLALGATRARVTRQLLTESAILAAAGSAIGLACAAAVRGALLAMISADGSRVSLALHTDLRLLAFTAVVGVGTVVLFGFAPAWQSVRAASAASALAAVDSRVSGSNRLGALLIAAQVAISLVLLTGAGLFLRTIANLRDVDLGFTPERLVVLDVNPEAAGYNGDRSVALGRTLLERMTALPGVSAASVSENGVLMGRDSTTDRLRPADFVAGREGIPRTHWDIVGPEYFSTLGTPLLAGRDFESADDGRAPPVVAVNEELARAFFPGANAIGRRLRWSVGRRDVELEIIAVARDVKQTGPRGKPVLRFYLPYLQMPRIRPDWVMASTRFLVRTTAGPVSIAPQLRAVLAAVDARLAVAGLEVGPDLVRRTLARERMLAAVLVAFGVVAVALSALGLYGSISYYVAQRTVEIGIRVALGARRRHVLWDVMRRNVACVAAGLVVGVPLAFGGSGLAQALLFGLSGVDVPTLFAAAGVIALTAVGAAYVPARRALRADPSTALRAN